MAEVPLRDVLGFLVLRGTMDGVPVSLLLDSGAEAGLITPDAAAAFGLRGSNAGKVVIEGTGGQGAVSRAVVLPRLQLGALTVGGLALPVAPLPAAPRVWPPVAGLIGADLLTRFDIELDVPRGMMTLHQPSPACGHVPPFAQADPVPLHRLADRLAAEVAVNGRTLLALVDTGARSIVVSNRAARDLGVTQAMLDRDPGGMTGGVDMHDVPFHWHHFATLRIGAAVMRNMALTVTELRDDADMLLGADFLARQHVWISWANGMMWLAPGPRGPAGKAGSGPASSG